MKLGMYELALTLCVVLKMAGIAFATTPYLLMFGYYLGATGVTIAIIFATVNLLLLLGVAKRTT